MGIGHVILRMTGETARLAFAALQICAMTFGATGGSRCQNFLAMKIRRGYLRPAYRMRLGGQRILILGASLPTNTHQK